MKDLDSNWINLTHIPTPQSEQHLRKVNNISTYKLHNFYLNN